MNICFLSERLSHGDEMDESLTHETTTSAFLAHDEEQLDELNEHLVGYYENQDYNYRVDTKSVELTAAQYDALKKAILAEEAEEKTINDSVAESDDQEV